MFLKKVALVLIQLSIVRNGMTYAIELNSCTWVIRSHWLLLIFLRNADPYRVIQVCLHVTKQNMVLLIQPDASIILFCLLLTNVCRSHKDHPISPWFNFWDQPLLLCTGSLRQLSLCYSLMGHVEALALYLFSILLYICYQSLDQTTEPCGNKKNQER